MGKIRTLPKGKNHGFRIDYENGNQYEFEPAKGNVLKVIIRRQELNDLEGIFSTHALKEIIAQVDETDRHYITKRDIKDALCNE